MTSIHDTRQSTRREALISVNESPQAEINFLPSSPTASPVAGKLVSGGKVVSVGMAGTIINISKCFMGASTFELPWAFDKAGLVGGTVGVLVFALLSNICFYFLTRLSHSCGLERPTYPQLGRACLGPSGEAMVWFGMVAMTIGVVGSYLNFVGQIFADLFNSPSLPQDVCVLLAVV